MEALKTHTGIAAPFDAANVDTDQIIPKQFLLAVDRKGFGKHLFHERRYLDAAETTENPDFVLNREPYRKSSILVARSNFGNGSSREHAVWGLMQYGIRAVIAPSFGEIFYSNCFNNGLLAARVTPEADERLLALLSAPTPQTLTISVEDRTITTAAGEVFPFTIGERHRTMLLEGLDAVETTMKDMDEIRRWKEAHEKAFPWMAGLPGRSASGR